MLPNRDAGVAEGVGVGVGLCADNSPAATTVKAKAKQRLNPRSPPKPAHGYEWIKKSLTWQAKNSVDVVKSRNGKLCSR